MSNFLVCLFLLIIARCANQTFVSEKLPSIIALVIVAAILDIVRIVYHLGNKHE